MKDKIKQLRELLRKYEIDGYIVPSNDEFQNECVPAHLDRLRWLTDFACSNGVLLVSRDKLIFFTDGRYLLQARQDLGSECIILDMHAKPACKEIFEAFPAGTKVGYDPMLHSATNFEYYKKLAVQGQFSLHPIGENLIDMLRCETEEVVPRSCGDIQILDIGYTGASVAEKLQKVLSCVSKQADYMLVTKLDSICWFLNIRGSDVPYTPMPLAYLLIDIKSPKLFLFTDAKRLSADLLAGPPVEWLPLEKMRAMFLEVVNWGKKIQLDQQGSAIWFLHNAPKEQILLQADPIEILKAIKNETEISGFKEAHIQDGVALTEFLAWLEQNYQGLDEIQAAEKLLQFRQRQKLFQYPSFETISAYGSNGAIVHYRPSIKTAKKITADSLYLLDSGGQYLCGTTDVTRTVCFGLPTDEQKLNFTLTLQGHIMLTRSRFPVGTRGNQLDSLARFYLWRYGLNYAHGTGHGVGHFLSVHEGLQRISSAQSSEPYLQPGMVLSNEPGYYKAGEYGIRIENLLLVRRSEYEGYLEFQVLTLVPIAYNLVNFALLTEYEKIWLYEYHEYICQSLGKLLSPLGLNYLKSHMEAYRAYC